MIINSLSPKGHLTEKHKEIYPVYSLQLNIQEVGLTDTVDIERTKRHSNKYDTATQPQHS